MHKYLFSPNVPKRSTYRLQNDRVVALDSKLSNGFCPVACYTETPSFGQDDCQIINGAERTTTAYDSTDAVNTQFRVLPFWPHDVTLWFAMLEAQFGTARITSDKTKFQTVVANITRRTCSYARAAGTYCSPRRKRTTTYAGGHLKKELIKRLGDSKRVRKMLEDEHIGDRTPSQFYRNLKNLATPSTPDDFILTLWESRLPVHVQHKILPEAGRIVAISAERTATDSERLNRVLDAMEDALHEDEAGVVVDRR